VPSEQFFKLFGTYIKDASLFASDVAVSRLFNGIVADGGPNALVWLRDLLTHQATLLDEVPEGVASNFMDHIVSAWESEDESERRQLLSELAQVVGGVLKTEAGATEEQGASEKEGAGPDEK